MNKEDAKAVILAEWRSLPKHERITEGQAVMFAMRAKDKYVFRTVSDRYQTIKTWLQSDRVLHATESRKSLLDVDADNRLES